MSSNFLKITFLENEDSTDTIDGLEYRNQPFPNSQVFCAPLESFKELTHGPDVKTVYQLDLSLKGIEHDFLPGDTIAILPENDQTEVNQLLIRLAIERTCDKKYCLEILKETTKKNAAIPKHLPPSSTLREVFLKFIDIRTPPKKLFLKSLVKYTTDSIEKEILKGICSLNGSQEYTKLLAEHRTLLSLLNAFPSCLPPIEIILEHSSPLNPRCFSIASSPLEKEILSIIFFVVEFESGLKGICTGWLQKLLQKTGFRDRKVPFYFRKPGDFRFTNIQKPSILIATGTGLAPFRGFLRHRQLLQNCCPDLTEMWMFYGCRYADRDFLCQDELKEFVKSGVLTRLYTAFSRDTEDKIYVLDRIDDFKTKVVDLITYKEASVFVCGDAKTVVKDVRNLIIQILIDIRDLYRSEAEDVVNELVKSKRYLVDSWI